LKTAAICSKCGSVVSKEEQAGEGSEDICIQCRIALAEELIEEKFAETIQYSLTNRVGKKKKRTMALLIGLITSGVVIGVLVPIFIFVLNNDSPTSSPSLNDTDSLTILLGDWTAIDGVLSPEGQEKHQLVFGDQSWTDYELMVEAELFSGNGYGIYYRVTGEPDISGYCFQYIATGTPKFLVRPVVDDHEKLAIYKVLMDEIFSEFDVYNQSHEISIRVENNHHTIQVDGRVVAEFDDDSFSSGMAGFRTWSTSEVVFRDLTLSEVH